MSTKDTPTPLQRAEAAHANWLAARDARQAVPAEREPAIHGSAPPDERSAAWQAYDDARTAERDAWRQKCDAQSALDDIVDANEASLRAERKANTRRPRTR